MKRGLAMMTPVLLALALPLPAAEQCSIEQLARSPKAVGPWLDQNNWLAPENLRFGLQSAGSFMSASRIKGAATPEIARPLARQLELDKIKATDPLDQQQSDVAFLLETRLYADGVLILRNGRVIGERYWNGLTAQRPRLLLGGTRPILSLLGAIAVTQGKLSPDKSVMRHIPALSGLTGLRKLSVRRLLEGDGRFDWSTSEIADWQAAGGWTSVKAGSGIRAWLTQPGLWDKELSSETPALTDAGPEADLLVWLLTDSYRATLAQIFCEDLFSRLRPESPALWVTDPQGIELSGGLALSLRDFARLGQLLVEARNSSRRSRIPTWFIETLNASTGLRTAKGPDLAGLKQGSEIRYGFIHLGGARNRIAIVGPYGNSLYIDFDRQLVVAIFAAYPKNHSAAMRATLEQVWNAVGSATQPAGKR